MAKLWGGRFEKETAQEVEEFSSSIQIDKRLWSADIQASVAHARMLGQQGILLAPEAEQIIQALLAVHEELKTGQSVLSLEAEDIHSEIELKLREKIGGLAGKLHTARSRNDQVVTDTRLYLREEIKGLAQEIHLLQQELVKTSEQHLLTILPGLTHFQHAQPVSLAHHLLAYFWMLARDGERFSQTLARVNTLPLGAAALAGTSFPIDPQSVAKELGFVALCENSLDAVSDRDFVIEFLSNGSLLMMHLSRLCEELVRWSMPEFNFLELSDEVTTGSSIMPQKKNPDVAELIRGRVGRLYGNLMGALTMMKGLPLAYHRDFQEDKTFLFEGIDTLRSSLRLMLLMLQKANWKKENMANALRGDFSNATDLADDLVRKGLSFREAHELTGQIVQSCLKNQQILEELTLEQLQQLSPLFDQKSVEGLSHLAVMTARTSPGGTSPEAVRVQLTQAKALLVQGPGEFQ